MNIVMKWLNDNNMTQNELGKQAGISSAFMSQINTGKRMPTSETITKISEITGLSFVELLLSYNDIDVNEVYHKQNIIISGLKAENAQLYAKLYVISKIVGAN